MGYNMNCIFVGVFKSGSTNVSQVRCLRDQGCATIKYPYRNVSELMGTIKRDAWLVSLIHELKPDFVLLSKANTINKSVILACENVTKFVLWYMDPMNSNWNQELIEKIKLCYASCFALSKPYEESKKYSINTHFIHEGFDPTVDKPYDEQEIYPVTFIGSLDGHRKNYLQGIDYHTEAAWEEDHAKLVSKSSINLNFVRNNSGCSDRVYKVLAAKGFLLTETWPGIEDDFEIGKDLITFKDKEDLKYKIDYYLNNPGERCLISENGYKAVQKFSRNNWARRVIETTR